MERPEARRKHLADLLVLALAAALIRAGIVEIGDRNARITQARAVERFRDEAPLQLDPNVATFDELASLPRMGPGLARRIVAYRIWIAPFRSLADLLRVPGMGENLLAELEPHLLIEKTWTR